MNTRHLPPRVKLLLSDMIDGFKITNDLLKDTLALSFASACIAGYQMSKKDLDKLADDMTIAVDQFKDRVITTRDLK